MKHTHGLIRATHGSESAPHGAPGEQGPREAGWAEPQRGKPDLLSEAKQIAGVRGRQPPANPERWNCCSDDGPVEN